MKRVNRWIVAKIGGTNGLPGKGINMKRSASSTELWIGLAKVRQRGRSGVLGNADGAYANVMALAANKAGFRKQVKDAVEALELELLRLERTGEFSNAEVDMDLIRLSSQVERDGVVAFGTFHSYDL